MNPWLRLRIDSELDREKEAGILSRNGYEVRQTKVKIKARYERYVEYREREDGENDLPTL